MASLATAGGMSCDDDGGEDGPAGGSALMGANDFAYWLQSIDLKALGDSRFDVAIIDYSRDGTEGGKFSAAEIAGLKHSPGGSKTVLAYCSIGEAEDYRWYWQTGWRPGDPAWLGPENPEWKGNYAVRYWMKGWQDIVYEYLNRILAQGFDGVYLDKVDAYEDWAKERPTGRSDMALFVGQISSYVKAANPAFLVVPQNGHELIDEEGYAAAIDGLGSEDNYFDGDKALSADDRSYREGYLDKYRVAGKPVFLVDYCRQSANVDFVYSRARARGYVPYCTVRDLDRLIVNTKYPPD